MYINRDKPSSANFVTAYTPGEVTVGSRVIRTSFIMDNEQIFADWPVRDASELTIAHLETAIARKPELILLGTGSRILFPAIEVLTGVSSRGIGLEVMDTPAACRTFNILAGESRRVVAAVIIDSI